MLANGSISLILSLNLILLKLSVRAISRRCLGWSWWSIRAASLASQVIAACRDSGIAGDRKPCGCCTLIQSTIYLSVSLIFHGISFHNKSASAIHLLLYLFLPFCQLFICISQYSATCFILRYLPVIHHLTSTKLPYVAVLKMHFQFPATLYT